MMTSAKHRVEALLFSSGKTMTADRLAELSRLAKPTVTKALKQLQQEYAERDSAIGIYSDDTGWKMGVRNDYVPLVRNIVADTEFSTATMETLAVIAYNHPKAIQSEIVDTRGSNAYEQIKELERLGFIRKEPEGRSYRLKLTEKFFDYFDVQGERDIREAFKNVAVPEKLGDLEVVDVEKEERKTPSDDADAVSITEPQEERPPLEPPEKPMSSASHRKFLADLDQRINALTKKNDERDSDPSLRLERSESDDEEEPQQEETASAQG